MALPYITPAQLGKAMKTVDSKLEESLPKSSEVKEITVTEDDWNEENQRYELTLSENGYYLVRTPALEQLSDILIDFKEKAIMLISSYVENGIDTDGGGYGFGFDYGDTAYILVPVQRTYFTSGLCIIKMGKLIVVTGASEEV